MRPNHTRLTIRQNTYWSQTDSLRIDGNIYHDNKAAAKAIPKFTDARIWSSSMGYERRKGRFIGNLRKPALRWVTQVEQLAQRYQ